MHYLLALRRFFVVPLMFCVAAAGTVLILTSPPDPGAVLLRMTWLAGGAFVLTTILALTGPRWGAS